MLRTFLRAVVPPRVAAPGTAEIALTLMVSRGKAVQVEQHQVDPVLKALVFRLLESTVLSNALVSNIDLHLYSAAPRSNAATRSSSQWGRRCKPTRA